MIFENIHLFERQRIKGREKEEVVGEQKGRTIQWFTAQVPALACSELGTGCTLEHKQHLGLLSL